MGEDAIVPVKGAAIDSIIDSRLANAGLNVFLYRYKIWWIRPTSPLRKWTKHSCKEPYLKLEIEIDEEAFSKLNYIFINNHVVTEVEDEIRSHQMDLKSTIAVQPQKDKLAATDTMKNLEFDAEPRVHRSPDGTLLKFYVSSVTPVKEATSEKVADWHAWKGGILKLPSSVSGTVNTGEHFCNFWKLSAKNDVQPKFAAVGRPERWLKRKLPEDTSGLFHLEVSSSKSLPPP
ncbi:uncharacterized protein C8R40DRAFT_1263798 [Lentinula edodes]|uniref:uncharacterized protein n=1 Tax=Lentinula edodes TaxID=5353 RepID=UPI001E8DBC74|nr:uncharacterized protein C8R40DRAFT_1263798 [Lentinula edodes]KAH7878053.1 hypothetical protein C8R40DRAFT_1263798 [Lentinula edodes]